MDDPDDGLCCVRICIGTRAWRDENGLPDPPGVIAVVDVTRKDGWILPFLLRSMQALGTMVRELNPQWVDIQATEAERPALLAELRAHVEGLENHALSRPDAAADAATVH